MLWCSLCGAPGSVGGLGIVLVQVEVFEDGGAVAADLVGFEIQVVGGLADGVARLE